MARIPFLDRSNQRRERNPASAIAMSLMQIGWLAASPIASALTAQTISFAALSGKSLGTAPFTVGASASSALPVAFSSLTTSTCRVVGTVVTLVAQGTCTIRASQAGNGSFAAAAPVDRTFGITASALVQYTYDAAGNVLTIQRIGSP